MAAMTSAKSVNPFTKARACVAQSQNLTPVEDIIAGHAQLNATFKSGRTKTYEWRVQQIQGIKNLVKENLTEIQEALSFDLGRPSMEAVQEALAVISECDYAMKNLKSWMAPAKVPTDMVVAPSRSVVRPEPKGAVLIMSPWNFPVTLCLSPLVAALAAGNCTCLKPSELTVKTEQLLVDLLPGYVDPEAVTVVTGSAAECTELLKLRWDHIIFTGNGDLGRVVMTAAAQHLTPVTLELGGKSPTVILPGANLALAAKRIQHTKGVNAGQICVAPDYALVHKDVEAAFIEELKKVMSSFYGDDAQTSSSFGRIVNEAHFHRVKHLLDSSDGKIVAQHGKMDEASRFIPPTVVKVVSPDAPIMRKEIFGPLFPIMTIGSLDEAVAHINKNAKPLALYVFGSKANADKIIAETSSGGVCVNDALFHILGQSLPFGGVGESGMGSYHGKWGFDELSHRRAVMYRATWLDPAQRYPPYTDANTKMFQRLMIGPLFPEGIGRAVVDLVCFRKSKRRGNDSAAQSGSEPLTRHDAH